MPNLTLSRLKWYLKNVQIWLWQFKGLGHNQLKAVFRLFYIVWAQIHPTCLICCSALHFVITTGIFPIIIVFTHNTPQKVWALTTKTNQSKKHYASINSVLPSFKLSKQNLVDKLTIKHTFFGHFTTMKILLQLQVYKQDEALAVTDSWVRTSESKVRSTFLQQKKLMCNLNHCTLLLDSHLLKWTLCMQERYWLKIVFIIRGRLKMMTNLKPNNATRIIILAL